MLMEILGKISCACQQISVRASDQRNPVGIDDSVVVVNIIRDQNPPVFISEPYEVSVLDSQTLNTSIFTVRAVDQDLRVCAVSLASSV